MPDSPVLKKNLFATVAVDQPVDATYTYGVPDILTREIRIGSRVIVPLGRGNRMVSATVLGLSDVPPKVEPAETVETEESLFDSATAPPPAQKGFKLIADISRDVIPVPEDLLELARWISSYYCAPIAMTLATMVL